jgi:hypothetical protein
VTGTQFKALQSAAGFSDPKACATELKVPLVEIFAWRADDEPIPAWAVERLRARVAELAGETPERRIP